MKILLVEDETHKRDEIHKCIIDVFPSPPELADCVKIAVLKTMEFDYDLIILDMALSTFGENANDNKKGHDQAQGGIEVLRALKAKNKSTNVIIVTQYPDFYIGGTKVKLKDSPKIIADKYNQKIIGAILYHYKSDVTLRKITNLLKGLQ